MKVSVKKTGKGLDLVKKSLRNLDEKKVEGGYFESQGKHTGADGISDYSYVALAQALEIGYFPLTRNVDTIADKFKTPMPFMGNILRLTLKDLKRSTMVSSATKKWKRNIDKGESPNLILNSIGRLMIVESRKVFNNPAFFPQAPHNDTPLVETGELRKHFIYKEK